MTKVELISLLSQSGLTESNRRMIEAIINTIDELTTSDGTKQFPTALTIGDINKAVTIDAGGNAILYDAFTVTTTQFGMWFLQTTSIPVGANSLVIGTITNALDVQVNITKGDVMNNGPFSPPTTSDEFTANLADYITNTFGAKYTAVDIGFSLVQVDEIANGAIPATLVTGAAPGEVDFIETTPSLVTNEYYDTKPINGVLVGITDDGKAIVDVTNFVYVKADDTIVVNNEVMVNATGMIRPTNVGDQTNSIFVYGRAITAGNAGDIIAVEVLNSIYKPLFDLQAAIAAITVEIPINATYFVDPVNGDDGTGQVGRMDLPFQSINAVVALFSYGQLILLLPGTHSSGGGILVDGLTIWGMLGSTIQSVGDMLNADTTAGGVVLTQPVKILGNSILQDLDGGGGGFLQIRTNPSAVFHLEFESVSVSNISNGMVLRDGTTYLKVRGDYVCAGRNFRLQDTSNLYAEIGGVCRCTTSSNFNAIIYSAGMSWNGRCKVKAKTFEMPGAAASQAYIQMITVIDGKLEVELDYMSDVSANTYGFIDAQANTTFKADIKIGDIELTNRELFRCTGVGNEIVFKIERGNIAGARISASAVIFESSRIATTVVINQTGGELEVNNTRISTAASAGVIPITSAGGAIHLMGARLITDGVAVSIGGAAAVTYSEGSKANVAPTNPVVGNLYVNAGYTR